MSPQYATINQLDNHILHYQPMQSLAYHMPAPFIKYINAVIMTECNECNECNDGILMHVFNKT